MTWDILRNLSKPARANNESGSLITQFVKRLPLSLLALAGLEMSLPPVLSQSHAVRILRK